MEIYPKHILPYPQYHFIEQSKLLTQSGLVLIRHIESDKVQWIDKTLMYYILIVFKFKVTIFVICQITF